MKKGLLAGLVGLTAAVCLAPFEIKKDKEGNFSYKSLLVGVTRTKDADTAARYEVSFLNVPPVEEIGDKVRTTAVKVTQTVRDVFVPQPTEIVFDSNDDDVSPAAEEPETAAEGSVETDETDTNEAE